ncbi:hypothetical protein [Bacillus amyloliquefaciens]|uniref:hypothetical protein n=1 Tax=Bacillus amyloliquefaciens TaxID=1390 RepID=UPI00280933A4|nr:hypothetical protein [Bacillus amyloliquefaciens]MDQ8094901.1 hypothetical protein [Bacillus amyloliquefaciens]
MKGFIAESVENVKKLIGPYKVTIIMVVVLLTAVFIYSHTFYSALTPFILVPFGYLAFKAHATYSPNKPQQITHGVLSKKQIMTVWRVYSNDENIEEYLGDDQYLEQQYIELESMPINVRKDIEEQIPFQGHPDFAYCCHLLEDHNGEKYLVAVYEY